MVPLWGHEPAGLAGTLPSDVQKWVVTTENPQGCITNSDLELAASILHLDVATTKLSGRMHTIAILSDNSPMVY
jgi:hypothetical protein